MSFAWWHHAITGSASLAVFGHHRRAGASSARLKNSYAAIPALSEISSHSETEQLSKPLAYCRHLERLRCAVETAGFRHPSGGVVTVSIGCGVAEPSLGGRSETLLGGADHALYAAKALGKNRVANWSGIVDLPPDSAGWVNATQLKAAQLNATGLS